jgi:hypothetical protein
MPKTRRLAKKRSLVNSNLPVNKTRKTGGVIFNNIDITQNGHVKVKIHRDKGFFSTNAFMGSKASYVANFRKFFYSEESVVQLYNSSLRSLKIKETKILRPDDDGKMAEEPVTFYAVSQGKLTYNSFKQSLPNAPSLPSLPSLPSRQRVGRKPTKTEIGVGVGLGTVATGSAAAMVVYGTAALTAGLTATAIAATPVGWGLLAAAPVGGLAYRLSKYIKSDLRNDMIHRACYTIQPTYSFIDRGILNYFATNKILCVSSCVIKSEDKRNLKIERTILKSQAKKNTYSFQFSDRKKTNLDDYGVIFFTFTEFNDKTRFYTNSSDVMSGISKNQWKIQPHVVVSLRDYVDTSDFDAAIESKTVELQLATDKNSIDGINTQITILKRIKEYQAKLGDVSNTDLLSSMEARKIDKILTKFKSENLTQEDSVANDRSSVSSNLKSNANYESLGLTEIKDMQGKQTNKKRFDLKFENDLNEMMMSNSFDHQEFWYNFKPFLKNDAIIERLSQILNYQIDSHRSMGQPMFTSTIRDCKFLESDADTVVISKTTFGKEMKIYKDAEKNNLLDKLKKEGDNRVQGITANGWEQVDYGNKPGYHNKIIDVFQREPPRSTINNWIYNKTKQDDKKYYSIRLQGYYSENQYKLIAQQYSDAETKTKALLAQLEETKKRIDDELATKNKELKETRELLEKEDADEKAEKMANILERKKLAEEEATKLAGEETALNNVPEVTNGGGASSFNL